MSNNKTIVDEYIFYHEKYVHEYGKDTIVFIRVGDFFEAYGTDTEGPDLTRISDMTNLTKTKKDKKVNEVSRKNPYMMGFQHLSLQKFMSIIIANGFTVIIVDQVTPPPKPKREVTGIYSPGTYINNIEMHDSNNVVCIYIEEEKQLNGKIMDCIGMSVLDVSTGECYVYETYNKMIDEKYALDETYRFIHSHCPKEIIFVYNGERKEDLLTQLELSNKPLHHIEHLDKKFNKLSYQNEFLKKIYQGKDMTPIEYIDMEKLSYARQSLIILFDFVYKHNESFIKQLQKPIIYTCDRHLILGNDALQQLNVFENTSLDTNNVKYNCLYKILNNASTAMGKRYLRKELSNPLNSIEDIEFRYNCVDEFISNKFYLKVEEQLSKIIDIERLCRKMVLRILHPYELYNLIESVKEIRTLFDLIKNTNYVKKFMLNKTELIKVDTFLEECDKLFLVDELKKYKVDDMEKSVFKKGVAPKIDTINDNVVGNIDLLNEIAIKLCDAIGIANSITLNANNKKECCFVTTNKRALMLEKYLETNTITIDDTIIDNTTLTFKHATPNKAGKSGNSKIYYYKNTSASSIVDLQTKMRILIKKTYETIVPDIGMKYNELFQHISVMISKIDFVKSSAKTSIMYNYCRPKIMEYDNGFIDVIQMRHPIIERIKVDTEYIPHDIQLGRSPNNKNSGILLMGINGGGKSSLQKSIGLNLIMAQCGMYVAAQSFVYSPYTSLFARITGNDNMFKGLSQFGLEMVELKAILKRTGDRTLVIGDEVCRGTEHVSGNSIVAATIIKLSDSNCSFIFATHLHEVANMERIKNLDNIRICHLAVHYDTKLDKLIFSRELSDGSGDDVYGLTVAKYIIKDNQFMDLAFDIMREITDKSDTLLVDKQSKYNSKIYVDTCQICNKKNTTKKNMGTLDVHHINFQKNCDEGGWVIGKSHLPMNSKANLIVLCKECHYKVHHDKLTIRGYKDTIDGRVIDFEFH